MIFSHQRTILFIDKEKIQWVAGRIPGGKLFGEVQSLSWSEENLAVALDEVAKNFPKKLRIVVGEEFSYVTHFSKQDKKSLIIDEAQVLIPEKLQDGWDSREENSGDIQVMAVQQWLFSILEKALLERDLQVEAIEAESIAMTRMIHEDKGKAFIFAKNNGKIVLGIAQDGEVLATKIFFKLPEKDYVEEFISYVTKPKNISIERAYVQDETGNLAKIFKSLKLEVRDEELSPMLGICRKTDISGRDKDVLNIFLGKSGKAESKNGREQKRANLREKILLAVFLLVIASGAAAVYYMQKSRQKTVKTTPVTQKVSSDSSGLQWGK